MKDYEKKLIKIKKQCGFWGRGYASFDKFMKMKKELDASLEKDGGEGK